MTYENESFSHLGSVFVPSTAVKSIVDPFVSVHEHVPFFEQDSADVENAIFSISKIKGVHSTRNNAIFLQRSRKQGVLPSVLLFQERLEEICLSPDSFATDRSAYIPILFFFFFFLTSSLCVFIFLRQHNFRQRNILLLSAVRRVIPQDFLAKIVFFFHCFALILGHRLPVFLAT